MTQLQRHTTNIEVRPEFDAHIKAYDSLLSKSGSGDEAKYLQRTKNRVTHARIPEEYCLLWHDRLQSELRHMRHLWEMYSTMHRRFRGVTISDQFGYFGTRPETQGVWIDFDPEQDGEVHPINIVRPDIKANVAALLQVNVQIDVEPANQDSHNRQKAEMIQKLIDFFRRDCWTESDRTLIFDGIHKEGVWLIENYLDRDAGCEQSITRGGIENQMHYAVLQCPPEHCGAQGVKEIANDAIAEYKDKTDLPCPQCGTLGATSSIKSIKGYDVAEDTYRTSEIVHRTWGGFNFLIDRTGAKRKGIETAKYLQTMELVERAELEDQYPQFMFDSPFEWSYGLKCEYALANADWSLLYSNWNPSRESAEWDLFEKRRVMLHESAYRNYVAPQDWEFRGKEGELKFKIKRGQKWDEAVKECHGDKAHGFRMVFVNERLIDIETPEHDRVQPNFRKIFSAVHFQPDSGSFHSVPHWDSKQLQDDITLFNTLKTETTARNSVKPVWYNSEIFDQDDFGKEYIASKNGSLDPDTGDISKQVWTPPVARTADDVNEHLVFLLGIRREVSGVQPPMLGEPQKGQPYAAQRQQLEQSFMILNHASKSWSQQQVTDAKQKVMLAFENWTVEQFQAVASRSGEKWNEEDIAELVQTDLDRDVAIDYTPGSEQPQGNLAKELKFFNGLTQAIPLIKEALAMGVPIDPDIIMQILKRVDEFSDFDFDLSGKETSEALAQKRRESLSIVCEEYGDLTRMDIDAYKQQVVSMQPAIDEMTGEPAIDEMTGEAMPPTPITAFDLIVEELMMQADVALSPVEDVASQVKYFIPEILAELAKPKPNYLFVELMQILVDQFNQQIAAAQAEAMANDPEINANKESEDKKIAADKEKGEADRAAKSEDDEKAHQREIEKKGIEEAAKENDRDFEREKMAHELMLREAEVNADAGLALEQEKMKAAEKKEAPKKK
jgi:hypothetical protein